MNIVFLRLKNNWEKTNNAMKKWKRKNLKDFQNNEVHYLAHDLELEMTEYTPWHYRFTNGAIIVDVFPSSKRFRNLYNQNNRSQEYDDLEKCLRKEFNK